MLARPGRKVGDPFARSNPSEGLVMARTEYLLTIRPFQSGTGPLLLVVTPSPREAGHDGSRARPATKSTKAGDNQR